MTAQATATEAPTFPAAGLDRRFYAFAHRPADRAGR